MEEQKKLFLKAFEEYSDALFRHCYFRVSDRERALELVQDTFMRAWEYMERGETVQKFRPFLYHILNNLIVDEYRRKKSVSLDEILEDENANEGMFEDLRSGGMGELVAQLDAKRVVETLEELPEKYRQVLTLRYIDGLAPKEIAAFLEESENVVSVRIHRGVKLLEKHFNHG